jgi:hypothetical protein
MTQAMHSVESREIHARTSHLGCELDRVAEADLLVVLRQLVDIEVDFLERL